MAYDYDALYRLTKATGRQHIGINANTYKNNSSEGSFMQSIYGPTLRKRCWEVRKLYRNLCL